MVACGGRWQPVRVDRVIETYPTSTNVAKVMTDAGIGYLKGIGNPAGTGSLASELVGSELASLVGLNVPDFAIVNVTDIEIPLTGRGNLSFGPAFISRELQAEPSSAGNVFVGRLTNPNHLALLVVFDTWIRNGDRCPPTDYLDSTPNRDNLLFAPNGRKFDVVVLDHSHCFTQGDLETDIGDGNIVTDERVYGLFPEFVPYLTDNAINLAIQSLARVTDDNIDEVIASVPRQWGVSQATREMWADVIKGRRDRVGVTISAALIPQSDFGI